MTDVHTVGHSRRHRQLVAKLLLNQFAYLFPLGGMPKDTKVTFLCWALQTLREKLPEADQRHEWRQSVRQGVEPGNTLNRESDRQKATGH